MTELKPDEAAKRESARVDFETLRSDAADRVRFQIDLAQATLRGLTIVNGGAIVALFTLIGNQGDGLGLDPVLLKRSFAFFIAGLIMCLAASFGGFLSQHFYAYSSSLQSWEEQDRMLGRPVEKRDFETPYRHGQMCLVIAIAAAALSLVSFGIGSWLALAGTLSESTTTVPGS